MAAMESSLVKLIAPLFPSLDEALVSYLASVACDPTPAAPAKWKSGADALAVWEELLESYEAVKDSAEARAKCDQLFAQMQEKGLIKGAAAAAPAKPAAAAVPAAAAMKPVAATVTSAAAAASAAPVAAKPAQPASSSAPPAAAAAASSSVSSVAAPFVPPAPGSTCLARFSGDGQFYRAVVVSSKTFPVVRILVRFEEYGDLEEVAPSALKDIQPPKAKVPKAKSPASSGGSDEDSDDSDSDSDEDGEQTANGKSAAAAARLLHNPVKIGELGPSRAAARAAEIAAAALAAENGPVRELTHKEQQKAKKRQAKADRAARDLARAQTWNPDVHKSAIVSSALPLYLQSQHLAKKAGTKDIALEDLQILAPDNSTVLLENTELRLVYGRSWIKIMHVEQECIAESLSVIEVVINSDLERAMLVKEEAELNAQLKELESAAPAAAAATPAPSRPPSPTASLASTMSVSSISSAASSSSSSSSSKPAKDIAALSDRLTAIYERLNEIDSSTAHARASTILSGLQFSPEMQQMPTAALSGGWRMRVPTNHLDFPAVLWLESYLQSYEKTVFIVSHDRTFLDAVITDVVHFTNKKRLEQFRGDYKNFLHVKAEKYKNDKRAYEAQQMYRQHMIDFIHTFKTEKKTAAQDRKVGQAMSKQKVLDKMERDGELLENPDEESTDRFSLSFPEPGVLRLPLIAEIKNLNFKYPKRNLTGTNEPNSVAALAVTDEQRKARAAGMPVVALTASADDGTPYLLEDVSVRVELSSRIGMLGANGCGKSTLVKVLLGELLPVEGLVWLNPNVRIAYFTQHHIDQLNLGLTSVQWLKELFPGTTDEICRRHLGKFGLLGELALLQIGNLSGGQKSRLAFSIICWREPHMLILDEPTNHLDMETIDCLIKAVQEFKGAVIIISHDQYFLQGCAREFWSISNKHLKVFDTLDACKKATYKLQHE